MHELFQNPTAYTSAINPAAAINPLAASLGVFGNSPTAGLPQWGQQGYPGGTMYGQINPQYLQLVALANQAAQAAQLLGAQNPLQAALQQQQLLAQATLQNPYTAGGFQNPLAMGGLQNPYLQQQNPFAQQNPFVQQQHPYAQQQHPYAQQNPYLNPILAQQYGGLLGPQIGGQPYPQFNQPYGQINPTLAPQSWVGQGGQFGGGQVHPLVHHLAARQFSNPGYGQWAGM
jgi:hypothetical protein